MIQSLTHRHLASRFSRYQDALAANTVALVFRKSWSNGNLETGDALCEAQDSLPFRRARGPRMSGMWQVIKRSLFARKAPGRVALSSPVPVVALVVSERDRSVLKAVSAQDAMDLHFVESCQDAIAVTKQLSAPVILFDRDWPETEWRIAVEKLAASPHGACVILMSGVADDYLWQELVRRGGYDVLAKPLRIEDVARALKLALSHWRAAAIQSSAARVARL